MARLLRAVRVWGWWGPRRFSKSLRFCSNRVMASLSLPASW